MADYSSIAALYETLPPFSPYLPASTLPYLAFILLIATFALAFYFSTLPKATIPIHEMGVALLASVLAGFGAVALFCSVGVNV